MHNQPMNSETRQGVLTLAASLILASGMNLDDSEKAVRKEVICLALTQNRGNKCKTARMLGVHRNTLARHIEGLNINPQCQHWKNQHDNQQSRAGKFVSPGEHGEKYAELSA